MYATRLLTRWANLRSWWDSSLKIGTRQTQKQTDDTDWDGHGKRIIQIPQGCIWRCRFGHRLCCQWKARWDCISLKERVCAYSYSPCPKYLPTIRESWFYVHVFFRKKPRTSAVFSSHANQMPILAETAIVAHFFAVKIVITVATSAIRRNSVTAARGKCHLAWWFSGHKNRW